VTDSLQQVAVGVAVRVEVGIRQIRAMSARVSLGPHHLARPEAWWLDDGAGESTVGDLQTCAQILVNPKVRRYRSHHVWRGGRYDGYQVTFAAVFIDPSDGSIGNVVNCQVVKPTLTEGAALYLAVVRDRRCQLGRYGWIVEKAQLVQGSIPVGPKHAPATRAPASPQVAHVQKPRAVGEDRAIHIEERDDVCHAGNSITAP